MPSTRWQTQPCHDQYLYENAYHQSINSRYNGIAATNQSVMTAVTFRLFCYIWFVGTRVFSDCLYWLLLSSCYIHSHIIVVHRLYAREQILWNKQTNPQSTVIFELECIADEHGTTIVSNVVYVEGNINLLRWNAKEIAKHAKMSGAVGGDNVRIWITWTWMSVE